MGKKPAAIKRNEGAHVPDIVISRLPIYLRTLSLLETEGKEVTSSQELGQRLSISSAQIRKDLSHFGEFGKQGTGYKILFLQDCLREILHLNRTWPVVLVGFGDLGSALANYAGFIKQGFHICFIFDNDPDKIGQKVNEITIQDSVALEDAVRANKIKIAILAVPIQAAQNITDKLVQAGIEAILNYATITLAAPPNVKVQNIDPVAHLQQMTYYL
jgi:redox-sensing transcriptional repressor